MKLQGPLLVQPPGLRGRQLPLELLERPQVPLLRLRVSLLALSFPRLVM
jgi:hypothetical protein